MGDRVNDISNELDFGIQNGKASTYLLYMNKYLLILQIELYNWTVALKYKKRHTSSHVCLHQLMNGLTVRSRCHAENVKEK